MDTTTTGIRGGSSGTGAIEPGPMTSMRLDWNAARVVARRDETPQVRSIVFERPMWEGHLAGQHADIRLTSEDGYQAQRSYSIASAPEDEELVLTVESSRRGRFRPIW